jgi:flagellar assembly factor FliW
MYERNTHNAPREAGAVIHFAEGLVGLPGLKRWILVDMDPPLPMKWLQSLDQDDFRVPVTDPGFYAEDYGFEVQEAVQRRLGLDNVGDVVVMVISTISDGGARITGNLNAPLIVNVNNRKGIQQILTDERWPLRQEIDRVSFGAACQAYLDGESDRVLGVSVERVLEEPAPAVRTVAVEPEPVECL